MFYYTTPRYPNIHTRTHSYKKLSSLAETSRHEHTVELIMWRNAARILYSNLCWVTNKHKINENNYLSNHIINWSLSVKWLGLNSTFTPPFSVPLTLPFQLLNGCNSLLFISSLLLCRSIMTYLHLPIHCIMTYSSFSSVVVIVQLILQFPMIMQALTSYTFSSVITAALLLHSFPVTQCRDHLRWLWTGQRPSLRKVIPGFYTHTCYFYTLVNVWTVSYK